MPLLFFFASFYFFFYYVKMGMKEGKEEGRKVHRETMYNNKRTKVN